MKAPTSPLPLSVPPASPDVEACAVLVLDATGKVAASNESARLLWAAPNRSLVGTPVSGLLLAESTAADASSAELAWKGISTTALNQWVSFAARPQGGLLRAVRLRLERAVGGAGSFIAVAVPQ